MAINVKVLRDWLATLNSDADVCIDEGGLLLKVCSGEAYLEVGGEEGPFDEAPGDPTALADEPEYVNTVDALMPLPNAPVQIPKSESVEECGFKHYHSSGYWACTLPARHTGAHRAGGVTWLSDHRISYVYP